MPAKSHHFSAGRRADAAALLIYASASELLFGRGILAHPRSFYLGAGPDPSQLMWEMVWWPWAILHGHNPMYTHAVWAPTGYNLAWAVGMPAPSLALAPVTFAFGPVLSYNLIALLGPALTAWAGYLLCRHLTRAWWPSLAGGYVLGFSTYELGHVAAGQLHLTSFFIPPLLVLFAVRLLDGTLGAFRFVVLFGCALVVQFMISMEVFATTTVCGAIALGLVMLLLVRRRRGVVRLVGLIAASYAAGAIVLAPLLCWVFAFGVPSQPIFPPAIFSADLLATLIPGPLTWFAPPGALAIARRFVVGGFPWESGVYIGLPLLAIAAIFCIGQRRQAAGKLLAGFLGIVVVLSFGPVLHVAGRAALPMPWAAAERLPLLSNVLPVRMMGFAFIAVAIAFAMWLAFAPLSRTLKIAAALVCLISILPRPLPDSLAMVNTPPFFAQGLYVRYLPRDANVVVVPYGRDGMSMLWQAESRMYFRMAGGYLNLIPPDFRRWPIVNTLYTGIPVPDAKAQLEAFLAAMRVDAIVVAERNPAWPQLFASLGVHPRSVGGVDLYDLRDRPPPASDESTLAALEARADTAWFGELVAAAGRYLAAGGTIDRLTLTALQAQGLLPAAGWIDNLEVVQAGWPLAIGNGLWIGHRPDGTVEIGVHGSRAAVRAVIDRYGRDALAIYYPYPRRFSVHNRDDGATHLLLMSFSADRLQNAAQR